MTEKQLVKACLEILEAKKIFAWRNNTGAFRSTYKGTKSFVRFGYPGSPDIIGIHHGKFLGIECKVGYNKQSKAQKEFQEKVEQAGGIYLLVYTPDDLISYLEL